MILASPMRRLARASADSNTIRHPDRLDTASITLLEMNVPARIDVEGGMEWIVGEYHLPREPEGQCCHARLLILEQTGANAKFPELRADRGLRNERRTVSPCN